jgi:hypothetical protein
MNWRLVAWSCFMKAYKRIKLKNLYILKLNWTAMEVVFIFLKLYEEVPWMHARSGQTLTSKKTAKNGTLAQWRSFPGPLHGASSEGETLNPPSPLHLLKSPVDEPSSRFPKTGPPWKEIPVFRAFSTYPSGSPAREPSLQVPFTELPQTLHP